MPEKNDMGWPQGTRNDVQKACDALVDGDKQRIFNLFNKYLTPEQKAECYGELCPPPSDEQLESKLSRAVNAIESLGGDAGAYATQLSEVRVRIEAKKAADKPAKEI